MGELWKILFKRSLDPRCQVYLKRPSRLGFKANENLKRMNFQQLSKHWKIFNIVLYFFILYFFGRLKCEPFGAKRRSWLITLTVLALAKVLLLFLKMHSHLSPLRPHESSAIWPNPNLSLQHFNEIYARPWLRLQVDGLCVGLPL